MTQKENKTVNTDQAWEQLYSRLEHDGLLPQEAAMKPASRISPATIGWAAAIAVLCIGSLTVLFLRDKDSTESNLLTMHNEKGSVTLVTTLEDGSIVYLGDDTQLRYPEHFASDRRLVSLKGNALFDVAGNKERPFLIDTEHIRIEVTGTAFNVKSTDNVPFQLSVERGEVRVTWKQTGESLDVQAGETVTLDAGQLRLAQTKDKEQFRSLTGRIRFKDEKIGNILQVVNKRSNGLLLEASPSSADREITISFDNDSPEEIAELISFAFNLTYEKTGNKLILSEP